MRRVLVILSLAMVAAACQQESAPENGAPRPTPENAATGVTVATGMSDLGTILSDADGRTLYLFLNDSGGESTCYDDCAANWPALVTEGDPLAEGEADVTLLGTTERTDGGLQVTYNGNPLYYFAGDEAPGDTNGQGLIDAWYVVSPEGEPIRG
ncbi:MAG: COG4315 family predicted lipoprotein [Actinomycetota bacterium]